MESSISNFSYFLAENERKRTVALFAIIGGLGIIINTIPIVLTACTKLRETSVNLLVANMSVTELLMSAAFALFQNIYITYQPYLPYRYCQLMGFYNGTVGFKAIVLPPLLSVNRYVSLYCGDAYDRIYTRRNIYLMILCTWVFSCSASGSFLFSGHTGFDADNLHCCVVVKDSLGWTIFYCFIVLVPFVGFGNGVLIYCNWNIYKRLCDHSAMSSISMNVVKQHREVLYLTIIEMILPLCFHGPYLLAKLVYVDRENFSWRLYFGSLFVANSLFRSLVILTVLKPYRRELKKLIFRRGRNTVGPM